MRCAASSASIAATSRRSASAVCTLAILPAGRSGFLLGHNRDESERRAAGIPPRAGAAGARATLAPRDPDAGGSWIGVNDAGAAFAMLNASHVSPGALPGRGRIIDGVIGLAAADEVQGYLASDPDLAATRGFHLVAILPGSSEAPPSAVRFRWNGRTLERDDHPLPALFVSSGYDQAGAEAARGESWRRFIAEASQMDAASLRGWLSGHEPGRGVLSVCMHGEHARTVSRTLIEVGAGFAWMHYRTGAPCDDGAEELTESIRLRPADPASR